MVYHFFVKSILKEQIFGKFGYLEAKIVEPKNRPLESKVTFLVELTENKS